MLLVREQSFNPEISPEFELAGIQSFHIENEKHAARSKKKAYISSCNRGALQFTEARRPPCFNHLSIFLKGSIFTTISPAFPVFFFYRDSRFKTGSQSANTKQYRDGKKQSTQMSPSEHVDRADIHSLTQLLVLVFQCIKACGNDESRIQFNLEDHH